LADTAVTLLFDQSGSLRGQKIIFTAGAAQVCLEFLEGLGLTAEVLGFTTIRWRGGKSRVQWLRRGRPHDPGRLNDLLHIVYRDAGASKGPAGARAIFQMLRPDLLKENVDGEALEWASARLRNRPESRKILVVISDGAPVDDSTLAANSDDYLYDHLKMVIETLENADDITLGAVGLGFDFGALYADSAVARIPDQLGEVMLSYLERVLIG
jgi:cobaltochelatase CobT